MRFVPGCLLLQGSVLYIVNFVTRDGIFVSAPASGAPPCALQSETSMHSPEAPLLMVQESPATKIGSWLLSVS